MSTTALPHPPSNLLRVEEVLRLIPVSRASLYAGIRKGLYPKPVKIGPRSVAWRADAIAKTINEFGASSSSSGRI